MEICPLKLSDLLEAKKFTDLWIGHGYYSLEDLKNILELSQDKGKNCSFIARDFAGEMIGVRLTFAPSIRWQKMRQLSPTSWQVSPSKVAYFKSLFIDEKFQGAGLGKQLSQASLEVINSLGGEAVVCHSWLESPNNSSQRYLEKMGFSSIKNWPEFWKEIDYSCTRCGKPCICTGSEMIKYLKGSL